MVYKLEFHRKYSAKYSKNKQKNRKNAFFDEKKCLCPLFCAL